MHGGDIYRNNVHFDFSVNINPLGVPSEVQWVLTEAALHANKYPDILHENLINETAKSFDIIPEVVLYGNGASELIMAICHAVNPKKAMLVQPCFLGYEKCITGANPDCKLVNHMLLQEDGFELKEDILSKIKSEKPELLFLTNPNNPNGRLIDPALLDEIIGTCEAVGTTVVLDECFISLTGRENELSLVYKIRNYKSLIILRAFTKSFAIPGVRIGYCVCSKRALADRVRAHLPEWNLSIFAQMAGMECLKHKEYIAEATKVIVPERKYLTSELSRLGFEVYPSDVNFILFKSNRLDLQEKLLDYSILIRDCSDYKGLSKGFYRIAVKLHNENEGLITALSDTLS